MSAPKTFHNPILAGFHPDPSICRVGEDYYLANSTFEYFPGLPIYHSRDLIHWRQIGNAMDRPSQLPLAGVRYGGGLYAPTLRHHQGRFYLVCTLIGSKGAFVIDAVDPAGPWSEPRWLDDQDMDGSLFFDEDGKAYYTKHAGGERGGISQAEVDVAKGSLLTPMKTIYNDLHEVWNEGPHLYKIKGKYYLMLAEGGTAFGHMEVLARSDSPWGPFEPCPHNPILTMRGHTEAPIQCTGHADLVDAPDGSWWLVFLAVRPDQGTSVLGRETYLAEVTWDKDGWPVVNAGKPIELELPAPRLKADGQIAPDSRTTFKAAPLGPEWLHVRNPDPSAYSFTQRPGFLRLHGATATLSDALAPTALFQRQQAFEQQTRCLLEFSPQADGDEAGLAMRSNDTQHAEIYACREGGKDLLKVRIHLKGSDHILASAPRPAGPLYLEIGASRKAYNFSFSLDGKNWTTLAAVSAEPLGQELSGAGFTGAVLGVYAVRGGSQDTAVADLAWFEAKAGVSPAPFALSAIPTPSPTATATPMAAKDTWRIRCGGRDYSAPDGTPWQADTGFDTGQSVGNGGGVSGANDPALYQTERYGKDFTYRLKVPKGRYRLTLRFAETYWKKPGERVFSVYVNGHKVVEKLDLIQTAGFAKAYDKQFWGLDPTAQGEIVVRFAADVENAKVCAIELLPEVKAKK